jgi:hypothetical protein
LELVEICAFVEERLHIAEEIVDVIHTFLVARVDELADGRFVADAAGRRVPVFLFFEAVDTEETIAVEYELAYLFEAGLTFVSVLYVLVHDDRVNIVLN